MLNTLVKRVLALRGASLLIAILVLTAQLPLIETVHAKSQLNLDAMLIDVAAMKRDRVERRADQLHQRALRKAGWRKVFKDEFKGKKIRNKNWSHEVNCSGGGNREKQCYTARPENSYVADGMLHIVAREETFSGPALFDDDPNYDPNDTSVTQPFTSARLRTKDKVDFKYGRVEVRAKVADGQGMWPAIWMLPTDYVYGGWPSSGEIDIFESFNPGPTNTEVAGTLHYGLKWPQWKLTGAGFELEESPAADFHVYAVEWEADEIRWYVDGQHYQTQRSDGWYNYIWKGQEIGFGVANPRAPFDEDFHLILNMAVGGDPVGTPDPFYGEDREMLVDYVRVYECRKPRDRDLRGDGTGAGCGTIDESVELNADAGAPGVNDYLIFANGPETLALTAGAGTIDSTAMPGFWELNEGTLFQNMVDVGGDNGLVWDVMFNGLGNVFLSSQDMSEAPGYETGVSLVGGGGWTTNGEIEFDILVNSASPDSIFTVKLDSGWPNVGAVVIETPTVGEWQHVAVKLSDLMANPDPNGGGVDISNIQNLFVLEYAGTSASIQVDNVRLQCAVNTLPEVWQQDQLCDMEAKTGSFEPTGDVLDVYINEITNWDVFDCCGGVSIAEIDVDGNNVIEFAYDNDGGTNTVTFFQSVGALNLSAWAGGTVEFDMFVVSQPSNPAVNPWIMKTDCVFPCGSGDVPLTDSVEGVLPATGVWQHYTFNIDDLVARGLNLSTVDTPLVIFPAWGSQDGAHFYVDNVQMIKGSGGGGGTTQATLPVDFEDGPETVYTFGDFEGGVGSVVDNPQIDGDNGSAKVGRLQKFGGGQPWAGSTLDIEGDIDFSSSEVFTMKVWASRAMAVTFKLEGLNIEQVVNHSGSSSWEELTIDFTGMTGSAASSGITLIIDNGTPGNAQELPDDWTMYFDDISLGGAAGTGPFDVTFAVDMSEAGLVAGDAAYVNGTFNGWCGTCNPLTDMGGGIWGVTIPLDAANYEYKFTINGWEAQEAVPVECGLVGGDNGEFVNRVLEVVDADVDLPQTPYSGCPGDTGGGGGGTGPFDVTFTVDMSDAGLVAGDAAYVNGTFNGWCGTCNPLTDMGGGIWGVTIPLGVASYEYKFTINGWAAQEAVPVECGLVGGDNGEFVNRVLEVVDADVDLPQTPYSGCPDDTGGGGGGTGTDGQLTTNGDFEAGDLSGWTPADNGGTITADNTQASGSTWSGHVVAGPGNNPALSQAGLAAGTVNPGDTIDISFDMCGSAAAGGIIFPALLSELGGGMGATRQDLDTIVVPPSVWTRYNYSANAGSNVDGGISLQLDVVCGGDAACSADVYFDNVSVTIGGGAVGGSASGESCVGGTGGGGGEGGGTGGGDELLVNGDFSDGINGWSGGTVNSESNNFYAADVQAAGNPWDVNQSQVITLIPGETYTLSFMAKASVPRSMLAGLGLNHDPWTNVIETVSLTTEWQEFTYTMTTAGFGDDNSRVLFDMGAEIGVVNIDDVSVKVQGSSQEMLTNGSFDSGLDSWNEIGFVVNEVNNFYQADVAQAGNPWDVNLSQVLTLIPDETYTLTFHARSSVARGMLAGLGLNHDPWTNVTETAALTTDWQEFTYSFTTTGFGDDNSRVLFDMGAEAGSVFIDNVSLTLDSAGGGGGSGGGGGGGGVAGEFAVNGDFEAGDLSGWTQFDNGGQISISSDQANGGTYSGKLVAAQGQSPLFKQANIAIGDVSANSSVTVSFDLYGTLTGDGGVVFAELFSELDTEGVSKSEILGNAPLFPTNSWSSYSFTTTAGPDVSGGITLQLKAACGDVPGCNVDAYFDNVSVTLD